MKKYLIETNKKFGGTQKVYRFPNGYGASVIQHNFSYGGSGGLWELAVIVFENDDWSLTYKTPFTDDVIGHLTETGVEKLLEEIKKYKGGQ